MSYTFYVPTRTMFGAGTLNELHNQAMPGKKALLVISSGKSAKESGALERTISELTQAGADHVLFSGVNSNPTKSAVMMGAKTAKESGCDFIVALGGGSVMDAAKAIAVMAVHDGDYWDYIGSGTGKGKPLVNQPLPIVAVSTTAGTGSETDTACVITNESTHEKIGFGNPALFPVLAVVDPELMRTVPPAFTAYQGFDALFHSTECYISAKTNRMGDMYALTAIENVGRYLPRAVRDGNDLEAREGMAFANTLSGAVMTISGCTAEHSLEHAMSAYHEDLPHGAGLLMIAKAYYTHFIQAGVCDDRFIRMAQALGTRDTSQPMDFIEALQYLMNTCGVADLKMSDYGITPSEFEMMARNAKDTMGRLFLNDRQPLTEADCIQIYNKSFQ